MRLRSIAFVLAAAFVVAPQAPSVVVLAMFSTEVSAARHYASGGEPVDDRPTNKLGTAPGVLASTAPIAPPAPTAADLLARIRAAAPAPREVEPPLEADTPLRPPEHRSTAPPPLRGPPALAV